MKASKGERGYFRYERRRRALITAGLLLLPVIILVTGILLTGTTKNLFTVIGLVSMIPFALALTNAVPVFLHKSLPDEEYDAIRAHEGTLLMAYELFVTHSKASTMVDAFAICGGNVVGYVSERSGDPKFTQDYVKRALRSAGHSADVKLMTDLRAFLARMDSLNEHAESIRKDFTYRPDPAYPDYNGEELIWNTLAQISL